MNRAKQRDAGQRTNSETAESRLSRRRFLATAAAASATTMVGEVDAAETKRWAAKSPEGFVRLRVPGKIVRVTKGNTLQDNGAWPKRKAARLMLERAMAELTGKSDLGEAFGLFVHPGDKVAIKPNGIAGRKTRKMAASKELTLAVVEGVVAAGVPAENITIFEQYPSFLWATRIVTDKTLKLDPDFPAGIATHVHRNGNASMDSISVGGIPTKYVSAFTDATAVINVSQIKDHSICGYTGLLKNITHGCNINPHHFHQHNASPQIAHLYAQEVVRSRVVLHVTDGFQVIYDGGPIDKNPKNRLPHEAVYVATDPVAMDVVGWKVIENIRKEKGLPTLEAAGREPSYLRVAGELGLGVYDQNLIRLRDVSL
jgi:uncharacterized protein (DUF362 family)